MYVKTCACWFKKPPASFFAPPPKKMFRFSHFFLGINKIFSHRHFGQVTCECLDERRKPQPVPARAPWLPVMGCWAICLKSLIFWLPFYDFSPQNKKIFKRNLRFMRAWNAMNVIKLSQAPWFLLKFTHSKIRVVYFQLWNFRGKILVQ